MFTEDRPSFEGRHYRIHEAYNVPKPVQPGGPPILIGGGGEQRTLRIAAKHADMTHWFPLGFDVLRHKTEVLEGYCAEIGRDASKVALLGLVERLAADGRQRAAWKAGWSSSSTSPASRPSTRTSRTTCSRPPR